MHRRTDQSRATWGMALLDWAVATGLITGGGVVIGLAVGNGASALRPLPYALACVGSMVLAAHRLGARLPDYFRTRLGAPP